MLKKSLLTVVCILVLGLFAVQPLAAPASGVTPALTNPPETRSTDMTCFGNWPTSGLFASAYQVAVGDWFSLEWCDPEYYIASNNYFVLDHFEVYYAPVGNWIYMDSTMGLELEYLRAPSPATVDFKVVVYGTYEYGGNPFATKFTSNTITIKFSTGLRCAGNPSPADGAPGISLTPTLSWDAVPGADAYDVYLCDNPTQLVYKATITGTSYTAEPLNANSRYYWAARAKNSDIYATGCNSWTFTTGGGSGGCSGTPVFIPAAAHIEGSGGSHWRTDVGLYNPSSSTASVSLKYLPQGGDNSSAPCQTIGPVSAGASLLLSDILGPDARDDNKAGGLAIFSSYALVVNSRTYNQAAGTYGQGIPGHPASQAMGVGPQRVLSQLHENSGFRTNVGFLNPGGTSATVELTLFGGDGSNLGTLSYTLQPFEQKQIGQIYRQVTFTDVKNGRIILAVTEGSVLAYASVVDNTTGDPTYIEPQNIY